MKRVLFSAVILLFLAGMAASGQSKGTTTDTVTIGNGTVETSYPFATFWQSGRTQVVYTAQEIQSAGGGPGMIRAIGFDFSSVAGDTLIDFHINLQTSDTTMLYGWITEGFTNVFSGTYRIPGAGWQLFQLQTPFEYLGQNLLVEICYGPDHSTSQMSPVLATPDLTYMTYYYYVDNVPGCSLSSGAHGDDRPNVRLLESLYGGVSDPGVHRMPLVIYPNPATDFVNIDWKGMPADVDIISLSGKTMSISKQLMDGKIRIDVSGLPTGLYAARILTNEGIRIGRLAIAR
jgi:hypothetical protein